MLSEIQLKTFNQNKEKQVLTIPLSGILIFVGPNHSGKSLILRELEQHLTSNADIANAKLLNNYELNWDEANSINELIKPLINNSAITAADTYQLRSVSYTGEKTSNIHMPSLSAWIANRDKNNLTSAVYRHFLLRLDGKTRFDLTNDQNYGDLLETQNNMLQKVFIDETIRSNIREHIHDAFGYYFVLDPTKGGTLRIRLSNTSPPSTKVEQALDIEARNFHSAAHHIKTMSDGIQAYVGIVCAASSGEFKALLIDEPEAFLHPPLRKKLGKQLSEISQKHAGRLIAATHSSDFVLGCIQSGASVTIVRLDYKDGVSKATVIDDSSLKSLVEHPLMKSSNVMSALSYDGVIVTESDNDRCFYHEIYDRLTKNQSNPPNILFLNAQNKQTVVDVLKPLRKFGIPVAAIVDIDIVKEKKPFTNLLKGTNIPEALHDGYSSQRNAINAEFIKISGKDMKRDGGIELLDSAQKAAANDLFDNLDKYGIFVVRSGELESWLKSLEVSSSKTTWTINMLNKIHELDLKPELNDVWKFITKIKDWVANPNRSGM